MLQFIEKKKAFKFKHLHDTLFYDIHPQNDTLLIPQTLFLIQFQHSLQINSIELKPTNFGEK